jgi:hypothetical protein
MLGLAFSRWLDLANHYELEREFNSFNRLDGACARCVHREIGSWRRDAANWGSAERSGEMRVRSVAENRLRAGHFAPIPRNLLDASQVI